MSHNEQHTPLTDEQLQAIRERAAVVAQEREQPWHTSEEEYALIAAKQDVPALLAEVERLRGLLDRERTTQRDAYLSLLDDANAARDIVQAVAKGPTILGITTMYLCNFCDVYVGGIFGRTDHRADCPISKARTFLASREVPA